MTHEEAMAQAAKMVSDPDEQRQLAECLLATTEPPLDETDVEPESVWLWVPRLLWHALVVQWRLGQRRFYVWRDRPTWVVRFVVEHYAPDDPFDRELVSQARQEMQTRRVYAARKESDA